MLTCTVVIATCNRAAMLEGCLRSLAVQTAPATEIIIVDASGDDSTNRLCENLPPALSASVQYLRARVAGASPQRNQGAASASGDLLVFVDDDAILEPEFLNSLRDVFECDKARKIGGVSGRIVNQTYEQMSRLNRLLFRLCCGVRPDNLAGRLVGPGITFLPEDGPNPVQPVDWLNSTGTAYRRDVFARFRFDENVLYPLEDLHLSARVGRSYSLMNSTKARLFHNDQGQHTERDWKRTGEGIILSRHSIAAHVLGRAGIRLFLPLFGYELVYCTLAMLWNGGTPRVGRAGQVLMGKLKGAIKILKGHTLPTPRTEASR